MKRAIFLGLLLLSATAFAHKSSDSYLHIDWQGQEVVGRWDIALRDLDFAIGLDSDGDGIITWGELRARHAAVAAYALSHLDIAGDQQACAITVGEQLVETHSDGAYTVLPFRGACPASPERLAVHYSLFFALDPTHRGLLRLTAGGQETASVLTPDTPEFSTPFTDLSALRSFTTYVREGVLHIWSGYDHVAFLLVLLLPAGLFDPTRDRQLPSGPRSTLVAVAKVVTAFTVAHSITLSLSVLKVIVLPVRPVEIAIALSIAMTGIYNVWSRKSHAPGLWYLAFAFGLLHGFGFANVLNDLGLSGRNLGISLAGFNVGVELGQLAIVAVAVPVILRLRGHALYRRALVPGGSLGLAALALFWTVQRALS